MKKEIKLKNVKVVLLTLPFLGLIYYYKIGMNYNFNNLKYYAIDKYLYIITSICVSLIQFMYMIMILILTFN